MMTAYRGQPVQYAMHDRYGDIYALIGVDGECMVELSAPAFLSLPNRKNLEVRNGKYRSAGSQDQRGASRKSGGAGRDLSGVTIRAINQATSALSPADLARAYASFVAGPSSRGMSPSSIMQMMSMMAPERERPALKRDGVVAGEIVGYRCWRIVRGDPNALIGRLRSVYQSEVWNPGEVLEGRELGDWDSRGIHAWKDSGSKEYHNYIRCYLNREQDMWKLFPFNAQFQGGGLESCDLDPRPAMVTGTIFMWGDVVEHEGGWRAEFARVRSLDWLYPDAVMMGKEHRALDMLRQVYGVADGR